MSDASSAVGTRREERRRQLLDDAIAEIRRVGPAATMDQLAKAGGVTKPILYRHFGDRDGLAAAVAARFAAGLLASLDDSLHVDAEPLDLLHATIDTYVTFIDQEPKLYRFLVPQAPMRGDGVGQVSSGLIDTIATRVAAIIADHLRPDGLEHVALPWAYGIVGLVHHSSHWWIEDGTMPRATLVDLLTALVWGGLAGVGDLVPATEGQ